MKRWATPPAAALAPPEGSDPYEEECFLILKSNLPKMKDEDALELYVKLKKSYKRDRGLMRYIFEETDKIAQE